MRAREIAMGTAGVALAAAFGLQFAGYRVNTTASMPVGVWRVAPVRGDLHSGDIVIVCLPDGPVLRQAVERGYVGAGSCPNGLEPLVKPVAAMAGDTVVVRPAGVLVNGAVIAGTAQLASDRAGRALEGWPVSAYRVQEGWVWLLSSHAEASWDSRYWGPVLISNVQGVAHPVWVR